MRGLRDRFARHALATLLFFVASIATPRAGFIVHSHSGGDHGHVHVDDGPGGGSGDPEIDRLLADALGHEHHHHRHHLLASHEPVGFEQTETPSTLHWHAQNPFHRAVTASRPALPALVLIAQASEVAPPFHAAPVAPRTKARSPPSFA